MIHESHIEIVHMCSLAVFTFLVAFLYKYGAKVDKMKDNKIIIHALILPLRDRILNYVT